MALYRDPFLCLRLRAFSWEEASFIEEHAASGRVRWREALHGARCNSIISLGCYAASERVGDVDPAAAGRRGLARDRATPQSSWVVWEKAVVCAREGPGTREVGRKESEKLGTRPRKRQRQGKAGSVSLPFVLPCYCPFASSLPRGGFCLQRPYFVGRAISEIVS